MSHDSTAADTRLDFFRILYDLIISQLEYDGYSRTSRCLSDELLENKRIPGERSDGLGAEKSIDRISVPMTTKDDANIGADHLKQILVWCFGINRKIASLSAENHGVFGKSGHAVDKTDGETPVTRDTEEKSVTTCIKPEMRDPSPAQCSTPSDVTAGDMAGSVPGDTIPLFTPHPMIVDQMTVSTHVSTPPASSPASLPPPAGVLQSVKAGVTSPCLVSPASLSPPLDVSSPNITSAGGSGVITPKALCNPKSPSAMLSDQQQFTNNNNNNICSMLVSAERFLDMSGPKKTRLFCRFCGKFFAQQSALLVHERIHTGEKPFRCRYCGRAFSQVSNMKSHERLHTGEKPYQCGECGKRFTQSASLRCHVRSHTGERPYSCTFCGKSFTQPASLQHHIRTHTGEKPYKCDHCDKKFTQPSSLVAHRRSHFQPSMPVVCPVCFHGFHRTADLKTHMLIHQTAAVSADKLFPSLSENAGLMSGDHQTTPAIASVPSTTGLSFNIGEPFSLQGLPIGT